VARIAKAGLWLLVMMLLTVGLPSGSSVGAYEPRTAIESVDQDPVPSEGDMIRMAPQRPPDLEPLAPGTGFIPPPMDLSHLKGQRMLDAAATLALPSEWDWRDMGMVTPVRDQASCGSCYAFGTLANFESKMLMDGAGTFNFSENHAKECNWRELNNFQYPGPGDYWGSCHGGSAFMLASLFSQTGTVLESCDPYIASDVACTSWCPYEKTLLDWRIISGSVMPDTDVLKQYIYDHGPVITSMYADSSHGFDGSYNGSYTFNYTTPGSSTNHLVLIVGWSNNLPHVPRDTGPADGWIVKNSWGTGWGDSGYFYITYGAANLGLYSSYVQGWQDYDADGDIWYYDDDGWWEDWGCDNPTVWALVKFAPDKDTYATRVEFWTTDATSDIDVYIYDDFNGSTPSSLLASKINNSFTEAGYHSVALDTPLPVTNGDDIIAVLKFTNVSYGYPAAADPHGTIETGRTYLSCSGSGWTDIGGAGYDADVAIRLRTSAGSDGTVTLAKTVINDDGGTLTEADFQPHLDGSPVSWDTATTVSPGTHTASETAVPGYAASAWGGDCKADGTLAAAPGGVYTCTITNDDIAPTVTLTKTVINDDGGTLTRSDFTPYVDGTNVLWDTPVPLSPGSHTISETLVSGYEASAWEGDCEPDGSLTVEVGGAYTCTIINDDIGPTVTLTKTVFNDNGGSLTKDDFLPYVDGSPVSWDTTIPLEPGTHTVSETDVTGYEALAWGGDCAPGGTLTATIGGAYTCTVTNDDVAPALTLVKSVVNSHGGTLTEHDFPAYIGSSSAEWGVRNELDAGSYLITEDGQHGYEASTWSGDCASNGTVSLDIGDDKTCTITNYDIAPRVTLTITVVNDGGGTLSKDDFHPYIDGSPASWGVPVTVISGTHSVSETQAAGYTASGWSGSCEEDGTLTAQVGGVYTCSVTNDDVYVAPTVALLKTVINDDGGTLTEADFQPHLDGERVFWYTSVAVLSGTHSVSETQVLGYAASSWGGDCETDGTLTAAPAGVYTCSVTNDDIGPTVILTKTVVNSHGGTRSAGDFQPYVDDTPVPWGVAVTLLAGSHAVSETQALGYAASAWAGDCAEDGSLVAEVGGAYTCTIANSDIAPTVTVSKSVINDDGGALSKDDFQAYINGTRVSWDNPVMVFSGTLTISETEASGYASSLWGGDCEADGTLAAELGGAYICSVINDDRAGSVTLVKTVVNDDGGSLSEGSFHPYIDGLPVSWAVPVPLAAGTHTVSETEVLGYSASYWGGDCAEDGALVVDLGGVYTCTVTNDDITPTVTLSKTVVNDNGGTLTRGDFYPSLDGSSVSWGVSIPLSAGSHTVSETQVSGYASSAWGGDCTAHGSLVTVLGGAYICTVTNDDIGPAVTSIAPNTGVNTGTIHILDLAGNNFQLGATVKLVKMGQPDIHASSVNVEGASKIACSFDLNGAATGRWSVVVTNPDSRVGVLPEGFMVYPPDGDRFRYLPLVMRR
jgi:C1A family cysteine protease